MASTALMAAQKDSIDRNGDYFVPKRCEKNMLRVTIQCTMIIIHYKLITEVC